MAIINTNTTPQSELCRVRVACGICRVCRPESVYIKDEGESYPDVHFFPFVLLFVALTYIFTPADTYLPQLKEYEILAACINAVIHVIYYTLLAICEVCNMLIRLSEQV